MRLTHDGLLVRMGRLEANEFIVKLRADGFQYGRGSCGRGLYSQNWDRMMGEWHGDDFLVNPSMLAYAGIDLRNLEHEPPPRRRR